MKKHFVIFMSPGTFVAETSEEPIKAWDVDVAMRMARNIKERHGATPYGFYFSTRMRGPRDLDSKVVKTSPMYYLGGEVETYEQVLARNDPKEAILRDNMKYNKIKRILTNKNSWSLTQPLNDDDVVLDWKP